MLVPWLQIGRNHLTEEVIAATYGLDVEHVRRIIQGTPLGLEDLQQTFRSLATLPPPLRGEGPFRFIPEVPTNRAERRKRRR